ncbi:S-receptor-like serine/threonine-protein kinase protein [Dioscorea alata]|uniref:S-receptor-like serine/threonine-protein kinase protein n=1 Tax=Dioscorea alata TaxID=55571 RepID=A0ACB7VP10_DIOAL|nr:S-receptor-like serine/threonine-protein kinase protein [Dioscorea alata]
MQSSSTVIMNNSSLLLLLAILILVIITGILIPSSDAIVSDTLLPNQTLVDGQSLVSANQSFELGFFSPQNSTNRYVGIWYHNISVQTVVWVGNRDRPVADATGVISFDSYGNLRIVDARGSSFVFTYGFSSTQSAVAKLLDNGNLVLMDANDSSHILYESFDYPTDNFLPGMKLGLVRGQNRLLTSWRNSGDPATGDFLFGENLDSSTDYGKMYIWQKNKIYWDSGQLNSQIFSNILKTILLDFHHVSRPGDDYYTYSIMDTSSIFRHVLTVSGQIQVQTWVETSQEWILFWALPGPQCDVYNLCGDNAVCDDESVSEAQCSCLSGFAPTLEALTEWNAGVTKPGCLVRKSSLQCSTKGKGNKNGSHTMPDFISDGFLLIDVILPADPQHLNVNSAAECQSSCLNYCNCTAYAFTDGCQLWYGNLKNLTKANGAAAGLYLRLALSELTEEKRNRSNWIWVVPTATVLGLILCMTYMCYWWRRKDSERRKLYQEQILLASIRRNLDEAGERGPSFTSFSFSRVADATENFSSANKLGEGGFGPVYKGQLAGGLEMAVKRLSKSSGQGLEEFKNEIILIAKLQHRNLVRLLGCCIQAGERILIYEYMPNKSLDYFLFEPTRGVVLDWTRRFNIIEGIAHGLLYLHKHSRLIIIHRDLKASNILLDDEWCPKISDFGLARIFSSNEMQANTIRVVGTFGYMSPEYASEGLYSIKSDVFSFGVLLLEIVSGKRNAGFHRHGSCGLKGDGWSWWIQ